jgi:hypothetical protein
MVRCTTLMRAVSPCFFASVAAALAALAVSRQFATPVLQLAFGLVIGSLGYVIIMFPQVVELMYRGRLPGPRLIRILRPYDVAARFVGLHNSRRGRHARRRDIHYTGTSVVQPE